MEREIIQTLDGSTTIHLKEWDECYHSKHGAIQEAQHVFIQNGLSLFPNQTISILEIGFGTGLNAFITYLESQKLIQTINYVGVEAYPVSTFEVLAMNYVEELNAGNQNTIFEQMHDSEWNEESELASHFKLTKRKQFFDEIKGKADISVVKELSSKLDNQNVQQIQILREIAGLTAKMDVLLNLKGANNGER